LEEVKQKMSKKDTVKKEALGPFDRQFIDFCEKYPEPTDMLRKAARSPSTKALYARGVFLLSEFLHKTPTEIVTEYRTDVKAGAYDAYDKWEKVFDDFAIFLEDKGFKSATVGIYYTGGKALINYSVPRSMRLQTKAPEVFSRTIPGVTFEDLRKLYALSRSPRERAFISILKDSGISCADAIRLTIKDFEGFDKGEEWIHINMVREKEHVQYETFLGPNAVNDLKAYLTWRQQRGEKITPQSFIFVSEHIPYEVLDSAAVACIFTRMTARTGIQVSTHRLRKFFETYMALVVRHPIVLKYWMGHKIRQGRDIEASYIIPPTPEQLKIYKESYKNIDITGATVEDRVKELERFKASLTPEQQEAAKRAGLLMRKKERITKQEKDEDCEDGEHCAQEEFRQVKEDQLLESLKEGWKVAYRLERGEVIIQR
jgi:integrase/recombinase XerD